ncbi:MAG: ABC transporter permease [Bryobacteraceae bacterium]|nr:ABC transporter permease [Bryobacteraceae bacterium]
MKGSLGKKLARGAAMLFALSFLTFAMEALAPGDYLDIIRASPEATPETVRAWERRLQLDRSWPERYLIWLGAAAAGDLGVSLTSGLPVRGLLEERVARTLWPNLTALVSAWTLALALGYAAARRPHSAAGAAVRLLEALLLSVPDVILALGALWLAVQTGWLPTNSVVLFTGVLTLNALPALVAHARSSLGAALRSECVEAASVLGVRAPRLFLSYVLPLAAAPLIALAGLSFGRAFSASLIVEATLGWPGLGGLLMDAIHSRDTPVVAAVVGLSGAMLVAANLAAESARTVLDARVTR